MNFQVRSFFSVKCLITISEVYECGTNGHVCVKCGIVFDVRFRQNNDCPVCHSGEHMEIESL